MMLYHCSTIFLLVVSCGSKDRLAEGSRESARIQKSKTDLNRKDDSSSGSKRMQPDEGRAEPAELSMPANIQPAETRVGDFNYGVWPPTQ